MPVLQHIDALERALEKHAFVPMSPWWRETIRDFYNTSARQLVLRVGRRGGKSSTLCRVAVLEALFGDHKIPAGDVGVVAIISVRLDEARERLRTVEAILRALKAPFKRTGDTIELSNRPIAFRCFAASMAGVVGFTCIAAICDEVARWRDADSGSNPATEVLGSLRPTMATQPNARIFLSSSPLSTLDAHHKAFELGDTATQRVAYAPTWEANPTISEEETHRLEPDQRLWSREYLAQPADPDESLISAEDVDACTHDKIAPLPPGSWISCAIDPATRGDVWSLIILATIGEGEAARHRVVGLKEYRPRPGTPLSPGVVLADIRQTLSSRWGTNTVVSDQWSGDALRELAARVGLRLVVMPTTAQSKYQSFENLRTAIANRTIELPKHDGLRSDLLSLRRRITTSGVAIATPRVGGRHCDSATALALALSAATFSARERARRQAFNRRAEHVEVQFAAMGLGGPAWLTKEAAEAVLRGRVTLEDLKWQRQNGV